MSIYAEKSPKNDTVPIQQKKESAGKMTLQKRGGEVHSFPFSDNRPSTQRIQNLQAAAHNSPQVKQAGHLQTMVNNKPTPTIQKKKNTTGLPDNLKAGIEQLSGHSMDDVNVHYNSQKPSQLRALAYAQGTNIHLGPGQEKHLPHEAWHVAQQKQGRVQPTIKMKGATNVNDDPALEKEADVMGSKALQLKTEQEPHGAPYVFQMKHITSGVVQRQEGESAGELEEVIKQLEEIAEKAETSEEGKEQAESLKTHIETLKGVLDSGDEEQIVEITSALKEGLASHIKDEPESETTGSQEVVQGIWGLDYIIGLMTGHPYIAASVAGVLLVLERVIAHKKKITLPRKLGGSVYLHDRIGYYWLVKRKINLFRRIHNLTDQDEERLSEKALNAVQSARNEATFLHSDFPYELGQNLGDYDNQNIAALLGRGGKNLIHPLDTDLNKGLDKKLDHANVSAQDRAGFSEALKKMPFVKKLYQTSNKGVQRLLGTSEKQFKEKTKTLGISNWKNKGSIVNSIEEVDDGYFFNKDRRKVDDKTFQGKVKMAERFIRLSIEPDVLRHVPRPIIKVHLMNQKSFTNPYGFRAYQSNDEIHIAQDEDESILVHELGHYIENNLPIEKWMDIQLLLHGRNAGKQKGSYIYPKSYSEQGFAGNYPATGKYTSKVYSSGHTEVMSMSMEYLAHPTKFKTLIDKDPQQAAIVLRLMRPKEFASTRQLAPYLDYLPK